MATNKLFDQLAKLSTEQRNPATMNIDAMSVTEILSVINAEDQRVAAVVEKEIPYIAKAVEIAVDALKYGGKLIYVGAGTSGRLGVLDAVECPPTFGTDPKMVQGIIAGGEKAMFKPQEGAEDREEDGAADVRKLGVGHGDVVCGIAASLRTPYVIGAVKAAKKAGARTLYITTNRRDTLYSQEFIDLSEALDVAVCPDVGPEVIMGSTRMKSGTAQKLVLNMITTASMIRLGKVFENMMIDLQTTNEKLKERAKRIVMTITGISYDDAESILVKADGHVKTALVMIKAGVDATEAKRRLTHSGGFVRLAIEGKGLSL
jgi:N-acetylmuramic acid 6-phosphate etherase